MTNGRVIPKSSTYDFVTFDLLSKGKVINPAYQVISISVTKEANRIPGARIVLRDGEAPAENFPISEGDDFIPGNEMEIKAGRDGKNETIFKGIITSQKIRVGQNGVSAIIIDCKDKSVKMTVGRHSRYFEDSKDSDAIGEVLDGYGFTGTVDATGLKHKEIVQHNATDWDFVLTRAELNGMLVFADDGKVNVKKPETGGAAELTLVYGATIFEFEAEMDARNQFKSVKAQSWDYAGQALFEAVSDSTDFKEPGNLEGAKLADVIGLGEYVLRHSGQVLTEELQAWADASMLKSRLSKIIGRAKFEGFSKIKPGKMVAVEGVGARFNGAVYITAIRHELTGGAWHTHVQFGLTPEWFSAKPDVSDLPAGGLLPAIHGLQIGKVVALEGDPDGEDRIQVKLPVIDLNSNGVWARLASLDAGKNRGWVIRPEIDDEVIVGFINADVRDAIVLGQLHSSNKPAPIPGADNNHLKGYTSRSEMKVTFDDENIVVTIETPAGNSIVITEKDKSIIITDQNNNLLEMAPGGITMKSPKDIKIEASGKIDIKASMDLSMEGLNIKGKANAQLKMEGQAGSELSSAAMTTVKGSMVMIN